MKIYQQPILYDEILLFDGLARSGRAAVAVFLSDPDRVDYAQILNNIDQIPVLWHLGSY